MSGMWGGRFDAPPDARFHAFQSSLAFDRRLWREDLAGSIAWARALGAAGVLRASEVRRIENGLERLGRELERDARAFEGAPDEDVHAFVERRLGETLGPLAKKLHTGRSRNDQVATDLKLWLKGALHELDRAAAALQRALVELAERVADLPLPGYTHLQRAQPITAGHHALAYVEMLARDRARFSDCRARLDTCPLGSGALAGTAFPIDREQLAADLGFRRGPTRNSLDAVSDRDHACEAAFACSLAMVHLSRLCEDWIFLGTHEAGMLELADELSTGSSLMPQKKNPDALELVRGKCGRVVGSLTGLLTVMKGLPLAYDKDMQEDKEALFDAIDTTGACLAVMAQVARGVRHRESRCRAEAARGYLNATDLADRLVAAGVPFRSAHERVGAAVREALRQGVELEDLPEVTRARLFPEIGGELVAELAPERVLARRDVIGGTAPSRVRAESAAWRVRLGPPVLPEGARRARAIRRARAKR